MVPRCGNSTSWTDDERARDPSSRWGWLGMRESSGSLSRGSVDRKPHCTAGPATSRLRRASPSWLGVRRIADSGRLSANTRGRPNCSRPALGTVAVLRAQSSLQASRPSRPNSKRVASRCAGALWCRGDCLQGSLGDREPPPYAEPRRCPVDGSILRGRSCPGALASSRGTRSG